MYINLIRIIEIQDEPEAILLDNIQSRDNNAEDRHKRRKTVLDDRAAGPSSVRTEQKRYRLPCETMSHVVIEKRNDRESFNTRSCNEINRFSTNLSFVFSIHTYLVASSRNFPVKTSTYPFQLEQ